MIGLALFFALCWMSELVTCKPHEYSSALDEIDAVNRKKGLFHVVESDIMKTQVEWAMMKGQIQHGLMEDKDGRWDNGILAFTISNDFSSQQKSVIRDAAREIEKQTCITLREYSLGNAPTDHVEVFPGPGCWSYVGKVGGTQKLSLQSNGCIYKGTIIHEFLHALGFYHEQSRQDRDDYIQINWENVQSGMESNFAKRQTNSMGVEYDPKSVMHYGNYAFTINGKMTLFWKKDPTLALSSDELTDLDILQLNLFYNCENLATTQSTTVKSTTQSTTVATSTTKSPTTTTSTTTTKSPTTTTSTTTTKSPTTTTSTTTTTQKPTTTVTTTTTTKKPTTVTSTTETMKPTSSTTRTTTILTDQSSSTTASTCGDKVFECVKAHYNPNYCQLTYYKNNCFQTCGNCYDRNDVLCNNFEDNKYYDCKRMYLQGHCTINNIRIRYRMKKNCPKTCCIAGRLYS